MENRFGLLTFVTLSVTACGAGQPADQSNDLSTIPNGAGGGQHYTQTPPGVMNPPPPPGGGPGGITGAGGIIGAAGIIGAGGVVVGTAGIPGAGGDPGTAGFPGAGGDPSVGGAPPGAGGTTGAGGAAGSGGFKMAMDECGLHTGYNGDQNCIYPPPPDQGFQAHFGPSNYTTPEAAYLMPPGYESTDNYTVTAGNDHDVYFYYRQHRLRPTAHHIIVTAPNGSTVGTGRRVATANTSQDFPQGGFIAPEDQGVGIPLATHAPLTASFHAINTASTQQLREAWINFWYKDPATVTQPAVEWFELGSVVISVPPHTQTTLGPYSCGVSSAGRLLWLYGHRHANNTRFTVTRVRGAQRDVIYDANKWEEPLLLEYSSIVTNPAPNIPAGVEGGWNGILDLAAGDRVEWSCDVNNQNNTTLAFTEQTYLGEMCIVDAEAVGPNCL